MHYAQAHQHHHTIHLDSSLVQILDVARNRLLLVGGFFALCFIALTFRLVDLGIDGLRTESKHLPVITGNRFDISRREIVDREGVLLATNLATASLYANPKEILDADEVAQQLHWAFPDLDLLELYEKLTSDRQFIWIKRYLPPKKQEEVHMLGQPGLYFQEEEKRVYPHGELFSHVLGMAGTDGKGLGGLEKHFDTLLSDTQQDTSPIAISLDMRLQSIMHDALAKQMEKHSAKGAAGVIMDTQTGEILSLVSLPDYNPNLPSGIDTDNTFNRATLGVYEMGSTFKTFTTAAALDYGIVKMDDAFDATKPIRISRFTINDHHGQKRWLTVPEIFMYSSNIGTARIADYLGADMQQDFLQKLRLLNPLQLELPETGTPLYPDRWGRINTMTISYGHGMSVTPIHVAAAMAAVVNGGVYYTPTLLKYGNDEFPEGVRVMKESTSDTMRKLLRLVVAGEEGTGKFARAMGYLVGGKTGTAEIAGGKSYDRKRMITSFTGAFPMDNPRYVVVTLFEEAKGTKDTWGYATAGWIAAPVMKEVVEHMAPLVGVAPVDEKDEKVQNLFAVDYAMSPSTRKRKSIAPQ